MKIIIIFLLLFINGCVPIPCLAQFPDQYIYSGNGCEAGLPDYRKYVTVSDNCSIDSFNQMPGPGFVLTDSIHSIQVLLQAKDKSGNASEVHFLVTLLDTIPPVIQIDSIKLRSAIDQAQNLYMTADKIIGPLTNQFPDSLNVNDSAYYKKMMVVTSYSKDQHHEHFITFADSLIIY